MVATDDRTIGTDNLRFMAKRAGSTTVEVDAPHVTDLILQAAQNSRPSLARTGTTTQALVLSTVQDRTPDLLTRWSAECPAVRLALAGLAVVFPTDRTLPALTPRLEAFTHQHPRGPDIGDYVRFVLVLAAQDEDQIFTVTEKLTGAYWTGTARGVPTRARALHLLGQMLTKVGAGLTRPRGGQ
ncbi:hypothetical protein [Streptomyces sp. NPDC048438]|uniref:hypothetical protein n=1 Tax=Streptomyces sp. NPDC048438 TaxID=3365551 RepID=UPI003713B315